jgi:polyhydroxybutyrate depolymerase
MSCAQYETRRHIIAAFVAALAVSGAAMLLGCGGDDSTPTVGADAAPGVIDAAPGDDATSGPPTSFGGARPAELKVPSSYDPAVPTPLVVALHGYSPNTAYLEAVLGLDPLYDTAGFLLIAPTGTLDSSGQYFWNATDACCNFDANPVDDVAYIDGLVDAISASYNVDPKRVYIIGHSNGGFMAHRLACDSADRFAAIISVSGATFEDASRCAPSQKVNVLQVHGTDDDTIAYAGAAIRGHAYPGAVETVARWATLNGCTGASTPGAAMDLTSLSGAETDVAAYAGCPAGGAAELWTVNGAPHLILMTSGQPLWDWLSAHSR